MIPLYGFLQGDTLGLIVLAGEGETMQAVAERLVASATIRVSPWARVKVLHEGRSVALNETIAFLEVRPLDRIDVLSADEP